MVAGLRLGGDPALGPGAVRAAALGLFLDLFWGGPSGLWALSLLVGLRRGAGRAQHDGRPEPAVMWGWYARR